MQSSDQFDEMDIAFAGNDTAEETKRGVEYLRMQVHRLLDANCLTADEIDAASEAFSALDALHDLVDARRKQEVLSEADLGRVADCLEDVNTFSGNIMSELEDVEQTIDNSGWPNPNPYTIADDSGHAAQEFADDLRKLETDVEAELLIADMEEDYRDDDGDDGNLGLFTLDDC